MSHILVTGGCGFIGSHTVVELLEQGFSVTVADNFYNSSPNVLERIRLIVGDRAFQRLSFCEGDVSDTDVVEDIFSSRSIDAVIHFAGYKAVGESVEKPLEYYSNNIGSALALIHGMQTHGCHSIIFSSSATVYGDPDSLPLTEQSPKKPATNPYGWTKWMIEQILSDICVGDPGFNVVLLRYFNPIGAHQSGLIGEDPRDIPNNLLPYIAQVAVGRRREVHVYGNDYPTPDGTGIRDYIHVVDLALGHVAALRWMEGRSGCEVFNLGTGHGSSVMEIIHAFETACGHKIPYVIDSRRPGDIAANYADCSKAAKLLGWHARRSISDMCSDSWRWQSHNPLGYESPIPEDLLQQDTSAATRCQDTSAATRCQDADRAE